MVGDRRVIVPGGRYALGTDGSGYLSWDLPGGIAVKGEGTLAYLPDAPRNARLVGIGAPDVRVEGLALDLGAAPEGTSFGISVRQGARDVALVDLDVWGNPSRGGIQILGGERLLVQGCRISGVAQNGVTLYGRGVGNGPRDVRIVACHIAAGVQPIDCEPVDGATCEGVVIEDCCLVTEDNYAIALSGSRDALVTGSVLFGALYLTAAESAVIQGCLVDARQAVTRNAVEGAVGSRGCRLEGNTIRAAKDRLAVRVATTRSRPSGDWVVRDNTMEVDSRDGVVVLLDRVDGVRVVGNTIVGADPATAVTVRGDAVTGGNVVSDNVAPPPG